MLSHMLQHPAVKDKSGRCLPSGMVTIPSPALLDGLGSASLACQPHLLGGHLGLLASDSSEAGDLWGCLEETGEEEAGVTVFLHAQETRFRASGSN